VAVEILAGRLLLWATAFGAAAALGLPASTPAIGGAGALLTGLAAGAALFVALAGRPRRPRGRPGATLVRTGWLTAAAAFEELVWRGVVLAALLPRLGIAAALAVTSGAFALSHRHQGRGAAIHLATGAMFGATFVYAGLAAAICAHAAYNLLVDLGVRAERERR